MGKREYNVYDHNDKRTIVSQNKFDKNSSGTPHLDQMASTRSTTQRLKPSPNQHAQSSSGGGFGTLVVIGIIAVIVCKVLGIF